MNISGFYFIWSTHVASRSPPLTCPPSPLHPRPPARDMAGLRRPWPCWYPRGCPRMRPRTNRLNTWAQFHYSIQKLNDYLHKSINSMYIRFTWGGIEQKSRNSLGNMAKGLPRSHMCPPQRPSSNEQCACASVTCSALGQSRSRISKTCNGERRSPENHILASFLYKINSFFIFFSIPDFS